MPSGHDSLTPLSINALKLLKTHIPNDILESSEKVHNIEVKANSCKIEGTFKAKNGQVIHADISLDERGHLKSVECTCDMGNKGQICVHVGHMVLNALEDLSQQSPIFSGLEFLDRHFTMHHVERAPFQFEIEVHEGEDGLQPELYLVRRTGSGRKTSRRKVTAADSYKLDHADHDDLNLVTYIKSFRQVLFYSQYEVPQKYPWGFWLSLIGHPRLSLKGELYYLQTENPKVILEAISKDRFQLKTNLCKPDEHARVRMVEGGFICIKPQHKILLLCQCDALRSGIIQDLVANHPLMDLATLLVNLDRLERVQSLFDIELPKALLDSMVSVEPQLVLQLEMNAYSGFSLRTRIRYGDLSSGHVPSEGHVYVQSNSKVIRRDFDKEVELSRDFQSQFPKHFGKFREGLCEIDDLNEAFEVVDWLKTTEVELEWLKQKPKIKKWSRQGRIHIQLEGPSALKIVLSQAGKKQDISSVFHQDTGPAFQNYIPLGDSEWLQIDSELKHQLNRIRAALESGPDKTLSFKNVAPVLLSDLPVDFGGHGDLLERFRHFKTSRKGHTPSAKLNVSLRTYQLEGYNWLRSMSDLRIGVCLADDMGLGKTIQALAIICDRIKDGPTMVVAPASVVYNWKDEMERFAPHLEPRIYSETGRARKLSKMRNEQVVLISYALALRDVQKLAQVEWGTLILDEAQFVKNALSKTAKAIREIPRKWTLGLTGTPLENHLGELWSIFRMINPQLLGDWAPFKRRFMGPIQRKDNEEKLETLKSLIGPFILRRTKKQVLSDLPERTEVILKVDLPEQQMKRYEEERTRLLNQLDKGGENLGFKVLAGITRLRQMACHPRLVDENYKYESGKVNLFSELVKELVSENHRALVFSQFTSFLEQVGLELNRIHVPFLTMTGETPVKHRKSIIDRFQSGEVPVFLVSLRAGGAGINLTKANYVFHMDPWWNPAVEEQATDRAHRIGQTEAVTVYRLIATHTVEESILKIHEKKRDLVERILSGQEQVKPLDVDEMIHIIRGD